MITINSAMQKFLRFLLILFITISPVTTFADEETEMISEILEMSKTPDGVVFELIGSEDNDYSAELDEIRKRLELLFRGLGGKYTARSALIIGIQLP